MDSEDKISASENENATARFLGGEGRWGKCRIELRDVQGLWGGTDIVVEGGGQVTVEQVHPDPHTGPGLFIDTFEFTVDRAQVEKLLREFILQDFLTIAIPDSETPIPDEGHPAIMLRSGVLTGRSHEVRKYDHQREARFDALKEALMAIAATTDGMRPISSKKWTF